MGGSAGTVSWVLWLALPEARVGGKNRDFRDLFTHGAQLGVVKPSMKEVLVGPVGQAGRVATQWPSLGPLLDPSGPGAGPFLPFLYGLFLGWLWAHFRVRPVWEPKCSGPCWVRQGWWWK